MKFDASFVAANKGSVVLDAALERASTLEHKFTEVIKPLSKKQKGNLARLAAQVPETLGGKFYKGHEHTLLNKLEEGAVAAIEADGVDKTMEKLYPLFLSYFNLEKMQHEISKTLGKATHRLRDILAAISCGISNRDFKKPDDEKSGFHNLLDQKLREDVGPDFSGRHKINERGAHFDIGTFFSF